MITKYKTLPAYEQQALPRENPDYIHTYSHSRHAQKLTTFPACFLWMHNLTWTGFITIHRCELAIAETNTQTSTMSKTSLPFKFQIIFSPFETNHIISSTIPSWMTLWIVTNSSQLDYYLLIGNIRQVFHACQSWFDTIYKSSQRTRLLLSAARGQADTFGEK